jgi:hypothetical protein
VSEVAGSVEELWNKWGDDLVRYATVLVGPDDAADVVDDTVVKVLSVVGTGRTVDLMIPREWFAADYAPPDGPAGGPEGLAKIIICEPVDDIVQISIWGAASAQPEDVEVLVDGRTIRVEILPTPQP